MSPEGFIVIKRSNEYHFHKLKGLIDLLVQLSLHHKKQYTFTNNSRDIRSQVTDFKSLQLRRVRLKDVSSD